MTASDDARAPLQQLTDELAVARAAELARAGDRDGALAALAAAPGPATVARLDLTARVHAQLGNYDAADAAWRRAAELGGGDAFRAERARVAEERSGRARPRRRLWPALAALVAAALVAAAVVVAFARPSPDPAGGGNRAGELSDIQAQQGEIMRRLDRIEGAVAPRDDLGPVEADLSSLPGYLVRADGDALVVAFPGSPFGGTGAQLSPEGDAAIAELGRRLAPHIDRIAVRVVGHTDDTRLLPGAEFADNESLALARALAAARRLARATGQPLESIAVATAGPDRAPFPNTSPDSRTSNRTVTIQVTPGPTAAD
ncbi:OmpA family protein [Pseudonocardia adelaidensis]|uniref:OmpA-like domain-containing protein n=1 Tax=Pseudonocardia adelaidensis TaxID=648754 RepID=A0ABP9NEH5_9PSEU